MFSGGIEKQHGTVIGLYKKPIEGLPSRNFEVIYIHIEILKF